MKKLGYLLFAFFFNLFRIFPVKKDTVLLFNGHNRGLNGNLLEIKKAIEKRLPQVQCIYMGKRDLFLAAGFGKITAALRFFVLCPYRMARTETIFLNDNFLPLGYMHLSKKTRVVQLWHGAGAFKKFGLSTEENPKVIQSVRKANKKITHLFVTSKQVIPFYQEAFSVSSDRIFATGIPVTDSYFRKEALDAGKERFYKQYPQWRDKKILLYTPTFRRTKEENETILSEFCIEKIHQILGEEWILLIRMHPKFPMENIMENSYCYNMTDYTDINDLYAVSDLLVTDYSSTVVEYVLLDKPVLLYAYDLSEYDRGFYRDYTKYAPGKIALCQEEFLQELKNDWKEDQKRHDFVKLQYDYKDGESSNRILDILYPAS